MDNPPEKNERVDSPQPAGRTPESDSPASQYEQSLFEPWAKGWLAAWERTPLYLRILGAVVLGLIVGVLLGPRAEPLEIPSKLVLRLLGALAAPLILIAVVQALMDAQIPRGSGLKLVRLLVLNTLVAIFIGLLVANVVQPGRWADIPPPGSEAAGEESAQPAGASGDGTETASAENKNGADANAEPGAFAQFLENIPKSILGPLGDDGKVIGVILIAIALGIALRRFKTEKVETVADLVAITFNMLIVILHWIIAVIPLAVFGIVASIVGTKGFGAFVGLGAFVIAVLIALSLQMTYYLVRIHFGSWARPRDVARGVRDALVMAFSTASSTATMPVTYACLRENVGLRERSASLGALVGANFNNDGTALYEAMAALFISQLLGIELTFTQQLLVVLTSVAASVGAAGIPEAGIVTMTLVFGAVDLDTRYIPVLLTVDWFLDRCRTAMNVMGDVNVSCLLDGKTREQPAAPPAAPPA